MERQTDGETDRQKDRKTERQTDKQTDIENYILDTSQVNNWLKILKIL